MKYLVFVFIFSINCYSQEKAYVDKVNGVEVYILSEPVREYEVLNIKGKGIQWESFLTGGLINESISAKVSKYIKKLMKEYKDQNIDFDAVIYNRGKKMVAINFTDENIENKRIANVEKIEGIPFYVMSEPTNEYEFIKNIKGGIKWKSALTVGLINNSIEQDLNKFAKKARKKSKKIEDVSVIYSRGKKAQLVKIKN